MPYPNNSTPPHAVPATPPTPYPPYPPNGYPYPYPPNGYPYAPNGYPARLSVTRRSTAKPPTPPRMSKAEALALTHRLKRGAVWTALAAFLALAGLVGAHVVGSASTSATSPSTESSGGTDDQQPSIQQNNPFFGSQSGGGSFGSNGGGSSQSPVTGSGVS